jgi:hypothetical protein
MKLDVVELCECCYNCMREHTFTKNNTFGRCTYLENRLPADIAVKDRMVDISKFHKCRHYLKDADKYTVMDLI